MACSQVLLNPNQPGFTHFHHTHISAVTFFLHVKLPEHTAEKCSKSPTAQVSSCPSRERHMAPIGSLHHQSHLQLKAITPAPPHPPTPIGDICHFSWVLNNAVARQALSSVSMASCSAEQESSGTRTSYCASLPPHSSGGHTRASGNVVQPTKWQQRL